MIQINKYKSWCLVNNFNNFELTSCFWTTEKNIPGSKIASAILKIIWKTANDPKAVLSRYLPNKINVTTCKIVMYIVAKNCHLKVLLIRLKYRFIWSGIQRFYIIILFLDTLYKINCKIRNNYQKYFIFEEILIICFND